MSRILSSYLCGTWQEGEGERRPLFNPTTEELVAETATGGLDFAAACSFARAEGGPRLRAMSFRERGELLGRMAAVLHAERDELLAIATSNGGNTRGDAKFDVDGCTGTLGAYARWAAGLGEGRYLLDGDAVRLSRSPRYVGRHLRLPIRGLAIHVNAFNFPAWGFGEKAAVALLAGVPVLTKPATSTAVLAERMVRLLVEKAELPKGALQLVTGSVGDLLDHVGPQDAIAFTGSAETGYRIRSQEAILRQSVRVNVEADSLNAAVLAPDVEPGSDTWELFVRELTRDMTQKAGQKCTAIRRVLVPAARLEAAREAIVAELGTIRAGNPSLREVRLGPLATRSQLEDVRAGIDRLSQQAEVVHGTIGPGPLVDVPEGRGWFQQPVLLQADDPFTATAVHEHEVFGPVATLLPWSGTPDEAAEIVALGRGSLVSSIYTDDRSFAAAAVEGLGPWNGRLNIGSAKVADHSMGPGTVLPQLVHGGPGRAGGGEELGGLRGLSFYLQRTALQGDEPLLQEISSAGSQA